MKRIPQLDRHAVCAAAIALALVAPAAAQASYREKVLHGFGNTGDGALPQSNVIMDAAGNFYGTAQNGGGSGCGGGGCGIVFKISPKRKETVLHVFKGSDGAFPIPGLVMDAAGNLYGTTLNGGGARCQCGTVFRVTPDGTESTVHSFRGGKDGARPLGALILDKSGNLYGTTSDGGRDCNGTGQGCGTVFSISATGLHTVLHAFRGGDGIYPAAELLLAPDGNFYGTAANGGIDCDGTGQGCGTVFKLTAAGRETTLYAFEGGSHGAYPAGGVAMDAAGNLYGTTNNGGVDCDGSGGCGVVFELAANGTESALHVFAGGNDGMHPRATPLIDSAGDLYGTAPSGGTSESQAGIVFRLRPNGRETILYNFTGGNDGGGPFAGLTGDAAGNLYGTTYFGGPYYSGTVFELKRQ